MRVRDLPAPRREEPAASPTLPLRTYKGPTDVGMVLFRDPFPAEVAVWRVSSDPGFWDLAEAQLAVLVLPPTTRYAWNL